MSATWLHGRLGPEALGPIGSALRLANLVSSASMEPGSGQWHLSRNIAGCAVVAKVSGVVQCFCTPAWGTPALRWLGRCARSVGPVR